MAEKRGVGLSGLRLNSGGKEVSDTDTEGDEGEKRKLTLSVVLKQLKVWFHHASVLLLCL